ncbi:hypothetical protein BU17DRAFT_72695 [Hysterangium stoloniferum]|nr:hypothetical protein BU17DRAFT_72695 [Hysterangium stoloniferum]
MLAYLLRFSYQFTVYLRDYIMSNENGKFLFHRENGTFADTRKGTKISIIDASSCVTMDKNPDRITVERVEFNKMGLNFWGLRTMSHVMDRTPQTSSNFLLMVPLLSLSHGGSLTPGTIGSEGIRKPFPLSKLVTLVKVVRLQAVDYTIIPNQVKTGSETKKRGTISATIGERMVWPPEEGMIGETIGLHQWCWFAAFNRTHISELLSTLRRGNWVLVNFLFCLIAKRSPWVPKAASLRTCYNHSKKRSNKESEDRRKENERLKEENKRLEEIAENERKEKKRIEEELRALYFGSGTVNLYPSMKGVTGLISIVCKMEQQISNSKAGGVGRVWGLPRVHPSSSSKS